MTRFDRRLVLFAVPVVAVVLLVVVSGRGPSGAPDLPGSASSASSSVVPVGEVGDETAATPLTVPSKVPEGTTVTAPDYGDNPSPELVAARNRSATIKAYRQAQAAAATEVRTGSNRAPGIATPGVAAGALGARTGVGPGAGVDTTAASDEVGGGLPVGSFVTLLVSMILIGIGGAVSFRRRKVGTPAS